MQFLFVMVKCFIIIIIIIVIIIIITIILILILLLIIIIIYIIIIAIISWLTIFWLPLRSQWLLTVYWTWFLYRRNYETTFLKIIENVNTNVNL